MAAVDDFLASLDPDNRGLRQRQAAIPALPPEQVDSALQSLGSKALGALGWVGGSLGKAFGGRAIRGVLGGRPEEALSAIPFSDTLGITDPANEVRGEDLLKKAGILEGEGEKGTFELRDLAGPAAEIALDPGTYLTFGASALTPAGKAAKLAGTLEKTAAGRIAAGQGGLAGLRIPFTDASVALGTGQTAQKIAGAIGDAASWLGQTKPALIAKNLFAHDIQPLGGGQAGLTAAGQDVGRASREAYEAALPGVRMNHANNAQALHGAGLLDKQSELIGLQEGTLANASDPALADMAGQMKARNAEMLSKEHALGIDTGQQGSRYGTEYAKRTRAVYEDIPDSKSGFGGNGNVLSGGSLNAREDLFDIPGGTLKNNEIFKDKALRDLVDKSPVGNDLAGAAYIRENHLDGWNEALWRDLTNNADTLREMAGGPGELEALQAMRPGANPQLASQIDQRIAEISGARQQLDQLDMLNDLKAKSERLSNFVRDLDPRYAAEGRDFFSTNALQNHMQREVEHLKWTSFANAAHDALAESATLAPGSNTIPLTEALKNGGLSMNVGSANPAAVQGAMQQQLNRLTAAGVLPPTATLQDLANVHVDAGLVNDIFRYHRVAQAPEALKPVLAGLDYLTNLTKAYQTLPWPANFTRDALTDLWQSLVTGGGLNLQKALEVRAGTDAASQELRNLAYAHGVTGGRSLVTDVGGQVLKEPVVPGQATTQGILGNAADAFKSGSYNPLSPSEFAPLKAVRQAKDDIYNLIKEADFYGRIEQGHTPEAAAAAVKAAHGDYSAMTPFERAVMRRVIPFYSWTRHNLPWTLEQLVEQPGGATATAIKMTAGLRKDQGFIPEYIGEGLALPVGQESDGTQRFFSRTGLPFEDFMPVDPSHGLAGMGMDLLGQTNPIIKGPLEYATGKQFYTGRDLADLSDKGLTGSTPLDQALMNLPTSRFLTTARTLGDERKDAVAKTLNLLTGARITDVDMDKQRQIAGRQLIEEMMRGNPNVGHFERLSVKPENVQNLSPEELLMMQLYNSLEKQSQQRAQQQRGVIQMR
jgi:hypothetical protein